MVPPNLVTYMISPSNQGNVPALTSSAGPEGGDQGMGTAYDGPTPGWQYTHGQGPEAQAVPVSYTHLTLPTICSV
eukprot:9055354-Prorocentrum_lima.AAC.1